jgi:putative tricarboxylic transport membrane protein
MSDTPNQAPAKSILPQWVKGPQDFIGGLALMLIAIFALWASRDLQGMHGFSFGAGTAPRMFAGLLLALGFAVMLIGILAEGPALSKFHWRGPFFVSVAIISFAFTIRPLGLILSAFASFMIAALGTPETRWTEAIIVGIVLTVGCALLFPYALGLPFQQLPRFMVQ